MPLRIPWDIYEVALLFQSYEKVANGSHTKQIASELSYLLRELAMKRQVNIDDTYRNANGMMMQLANVQYLFTDGTKGLSGASTMIREMYSLYLNHPEKYQEILKEALHVIDSTPFVEDTFFAYATDKTSLTAQQLSESLSKATDYCHLQQPLLGMTDVKEVRKIQQQIEQAHLLRFQYGSNAQSISNAVRLYYSFVKTYHSSRKRLESAVSPKIVETTICSQSQVLHKSSVMHVDFDMNGSYTFTNPIAFVYKGKEYSASKWVDLYTSICDILFSEYSAILLPMINQNVPGHNTIYFVDEQHKDMLLYIKQFHEGYYLNAQLSASAIVKRIGELKKWCDLGEQLDILFQVNGNQSDSIPASPKEWIVCQLDDQHIDYQDKRDRNNYLWIKGGHELDTFAQECALHGYILTYKHDGCNAYPFAQVWWTKDCPQDQQQVIPARDTQVLSRQMPTDDFSRWMLDERNKKNQQQKTVLPRDASSGAYAQRLSDFIQWMNQEKQLSEATVHSYTSAIKCSQDYIIEKGLELLLLDGNKDDARKANQVLLAQEDYAARNAKQNNRFRAALKQYIRFLGDNTSDETAVGRSIPVEKSTRVQPDVIESPKWAAIVNEFFPKGFKPSYLTLQKLRMYWEDAYSEPLHETDEEITQHITNSSVIYGGTAYSPDRLLDEDAQQKLYDYIDQAFAVGTPSISFVALYHALKDVFLDQRMFDGDMLKAYLRISKRYLIDGNYLIKERGVSNDLPQSIYRIFMEAGKAVSDRYVYEQLPHEDKKLIERTIRTDKRIVTEREEDSTVFSFAVDLLPLSSDDIKIIAYMIECEIGEKGFMTSEELRKQIEQQHPEINENMAGFAWRGCRNALASKLGGKFSFQGPIISHKGEKIATCDVFREYTKRNAPLKVQQLSQLCAELSPTMTIYWESVLESGDRISETDIVPNGFLHFDVASIDKQLEMYVTESYLPLKEVGQFGMFPDCGVPWNLYVLEDYVYKHSAEFTLLHPGFAATGVAGAIVPKYSQFKTLDSVIVDVLKRHQEIQSCHDAVVLLQHNGYTNRRRFGNIEKLLASARTAARKETE